MVRPALRRALAVAVVALVVSVAWPPFAAWGDRHDLRRVTALARALPAPPGATPVDDHCPPAFRCLSARGAVEDVTRTVARAAHRLSGSRPHAWCEAFRPTGSAEQDVIQCWVRVEDGRHAVVVDLFQVADLPPRTTVVVSTA